MNRHLKQERKLSEKEKKKIARDMVKGYKKMANLNQKLAEDGLVNNKHDETG